MSDIHRRATDVTARSRVGYNGQIVTDHRNVIVDGVNAASQATHRISLTFASGNGEDAVEGTVERTSDGASDTFAYVTPASATDAQAAAGFADYWNADADLVKFGFASNTAGSAVVYIDAPAAGADWSFSVAITEDGAPLTVTPATVTSGADAGEVAFGSVVASAVALGTDGYLDLDSGWGQDGSSANIGARKFAKPFPFSVAKDAWTVTLGGTAEADKTIRLKISLGNDVEFIDFETAATNNNGATAMATALGQSALVDVTGSAAARTLTAKRIGEPLSVTVYAVDALSTQTVVAASSVSAGSAAQQALLGVVRYAPMMHDTRTLGTAATAVRAGEEAQILVEGFFLYKLTDVADPTSCAGKVLYVGTSGAEAGKLFSVSSATRVKWERARIVQPAYGGVYVCRLLAE